MSLSTLCEAFDADAFAEAPSADGVDALCYLESVSCMK